MASIFELLNNFGGGYFLFDFLLAKLVPSFLRHDHLHLAHTHTHTQWPAQPPVELSPLACFGVYQKLNMTRDLK